MITKVFILYTGGTIGMAPKDDNDENSEPAEKPVKKAAKKKKAGE